MNQEKIGKFIKDRRKEKNITQQELAKKLGVTDKAISKWENGRCLMDISFLKELSEILDVSILELLSGEKIEAEDYEKETITIVHDAIEYADEKIKKNKIKWILIIFICFVLFIFSSFTIYKIILLGIYKAPISENYNNLINGLTLDNEIKIYKRTISDNEYYIDDDIKFRNDFSLYEKVFDSDTGDYKTVSFTKSNSNGEKVASFTYGTVFQLVDAFYNDVTIFGDGEEKEIFTINDKFNSADRKYFLLKNDINDDVDLLKYIKDNYYIKSNTFTSKREIQENYAFNAFVDIVMPAFVDGSSTDIIGGDYRGYMYNINSDNGLIINTYIIRNDKLYYYNFWGESISKEYVIDFLSTLEIK